MIRRVKIENYKSLKQAEVPLRELTVVLGPNAAGKSNLFDALNLLARLVTSKNIKEAFEGHRGLPLESVHYVKGSFADLLKQESHRLGFEVDVELSDAVVKETENRIRELRKGIEEQNEPVLEKSRITERFLRYAVELEIQSQSGVMRVMNERLTALRKRDQAEKARNAFIENVGSKLSLRMEGQARPTMHEIGLDYTIASASLYAPHYPHLTAFREELTLTTNGREQPIPAGSALPSIRPIRVLHVFWVRPLTSSLSPDIFVVCSSAASGSTHLPCSAMRSTRQSTASASGMLNFTGVLPT